MEIKLNRQALAALIEGDDEFRLSLSSAVTSEVIKRFFEKDAKRIIEKADSELFKQALAAFQQDHDIGQVVQAALTKHLVVKSSGYYDTRMKLSDGTQKLVDEAVQNALMRLGRRVEEQVNNAITTQAQKLVDERLATENIDERIAKRVERMLNDEIEKKVRDHHDALLRKMKEALA